MRFISKDSLFSVNFSRSTIPYGRAKKLIKKFIPGVLVRQIKKELYRYDRDILRTYDTFAQELSKKNGTELSAYLK